MKKVILTMVWLLGALGLLFFAAHVFIVLLDFQPIINLEWFILIAPVSFVAFLVGGHYAKIE